MKRNQSGENNLPPKRQKTDEFLVPSTSHLKSSNQNVANVKNPLQSSNNNPVPVPQKKATVIAPDWQDDDFDENELQQLTQNEILCSQLNTTYVTNFRNKNDEFSSSTQVGKSENVVVIASAKDGIPTQYKGFTEKIHNNLFADEDDEFFPKELADGAAQESNIQKTLPSHAFGPLAQRQQSNGAGTSRGPAATTTTTSQKENNQKGFQNEFYTRKMKANEQQIEKLRKINNEMREKLQTKDGEIGSLRLELTTCKKNNDKLRLEKMEESDNIKAQWSIEKNRYEKEIEKLKTMNTFQNMEMLRLKQPAASSRDSWENRAAVKKLLAPCIFRVNFVLPQKGPTMDIDKRIFEHSTVGMESSKRKIFWGKEKILLAHLNSLQCKLSEIYLTFESVETIPEKYIDVVMSEVPAVMQNIEEYVAKEKPRAKLAVTTIENEVIYLAESIQKFRMWSEKEREFVEIYQKDPMYPGEEGILIRRLTAIFSILCEYSPKFCEKISAEPMFDDRPFTQILCDCLYKLDQVHKAFDYMGFLIAVTTFLNSIASSYAKMESTPLMDENLEKLLRAILTCRPCHPVLIKRLTEFMLKLSKDPKCFSLLNRFCIGCDPQKFVMVAEHKLIQFTNDCCLIQMYGALLQTTFPQSFLFNEIEKGHLLDITLKVCQFFRNCFTAEGQCVQFLKGVAKKDTPETCNCYRKISHSMLILLHLCWKGLRTIDGKYDSKRKQLARLGVLVLSDVLIMVKRYKLTTLYRVYRKRSAVFFDNLKFAAQAKQVTFHKAQREAIKALDSIHLHGSKRSVHREKKDKLGINTMSERFF